MAEEAGLRQIRRRAQIHCPGGGVHSSPEMELTKIPDTSRYEQHRERFPRMQVKGPAGSRWRAPAFDQATHYSREHRRPTERLLADHLFRPQPARWKVVKVKIGTLTTISEAHLKATSARRSFVFEEAHAHAGIETRHSRKSNYRFLAARSEPELLLVVGVESAC